MPLRNYFPRVLFGTIVDEANQVKLTFKIFKVENKVYSKCRQNLRFLPKWRNQIIIRKTQFCARFLFGCKRYKFRQ